VLPTDRLKLQYLSDVALNNFYSFIFFLLYAADLQLYVVFVSTNLAECLQKD
jgi:hypothetical protein